MPKTYLGIDVLTAARERISWSFDRFDKLYISLSGGKDSTVLTHLVMEEAVKRNRKVGVLFIDWECQFTLTIDHTASLFNLYRANIDPYWVALPMTTNNACSQEEPLWTAWDETKEDLWVREKHPLSVPNRAIFPFFYDGITFEEFVPLFGHWYANGEECGNFIGLRTDESLNRFRTIAQTVKPMCDGRSYTTNAIEDVWNIYPIYDWAVDDIWTYTAKTGKSYNLLYDRMYWAGQSPHQMRIDEPFGNESRRGLWLYQVIEPERWAKMVARVAGSNTGALYSQENGNILGNLKITLPDGHTWKSFAMFIIQTMPPKLNEHYTNKIAIYLKWYADRGYPAGIPDAADAKMEANGHSPSWRRICRTLLRNDYWCKGIGFSPTKSSAYQKYLDLMKRRKLKWDKQGDLLELIEAKNVAD